ncbi:unnamed protein product, partial [Rotaria socialis]
KFDFLTMVSDQQDKTLNQVIPPYAGAPPYEGDTVNYNNTAATTTTTST